MDIPESNTNNMSPTDEALSLNTIATIMRACNDIQVTDEALFLTAEATKKFIEYITKESFGKADKNNELKYEHLAEVVESNQSIKFLQEIVPKKVKFNELQEYLKDNAKKN
ncbi:chromatin accessibility complex 16kD protein-like [Teleopsis dalmanni]|uniref:chromatin accessibility complex 16kD protein-like n=1 Tax=Teleopsis dalmanni TaxID=139649 RepID=UPI0018CCAF02|nr:chromatin accessibility complex 16kD protein-like [Teleopsis dalmanni]